MMTQRTGDLRRRSGRVADFNSLLASILLAALRCFRLLRHVPRLMPMPSSSCLAFSHAPLPPALRLAL